MWHDVETTKDLLNFDVVANTAAQFVRESGQQPISIGVSGGWGTGKSSLVKMIGSSLAEQDEKNTDKKKYVFIEFNAWLYQGYDDARMSLLQSVADKLWNEAKERESHVEKAKNFAKRVNWLRVGKFLGPAVFGATSGGALGGPIGATIGSIGGLCKGGVPSAEDCEEVTSAWSDLQPQLAGLLKEKETESLPQEIQELRSTFEDLLKSLEVTLVVLVDDLDRCLPSTAISTLEAMRLLLFMPRTAFIIAADEQMIRGAVRSHFGDVELGNELATSYFDKLIQVPLRVPRLGITEVKAYIVLLFAELAVRKRKISQDVRTNAENKILESVRHSWAGALTRKDLEDAFGDNASELSMEIDLADQLSGLMVSSDHIAGNPRLIKRFLNNLMIRHYMASAQGMSVGFDQLVKLQLFERCASPAAFEYLVKTVADNEEGKAPFLAKLEEQWEKGEEIAPEESSWIEDFVMDWVKLSPKLGDTDMRPLLHLSRDRAVSLATFDELSSDGHALLEAILEADDVMAPLIEQLKTLGETEAERILNRIRRKARSNQWDRSILIQALHIPKAFPNLGGAVVNMLNEIPPTRRPAPLIPRIRSEPWANELLKKWANDDNSPPAVRNAINKLEE